MSSVVLAPDTGAVLSFVPVPPDTYYAELQVIPDRTEDVVETYKAQVIGWATMCVHEPLPGEVKDEYYGEKADVVWYRPRLTPVLLFEDGEIYLGAEWLAEVGDCDSGNHGRLRVRRGKP